LLFKFNIYSSFSSFKINLKFRKKFSNCIGFRNVLNGL
jgi:hypothetical protein